MMEFIDEQKYNDYKFRAALSGIDLDEEVTKSKEDPNVKLDMQQRKQDLPIFRDPDQYDDLSEEEKEQMTQKMIEQHKNWAYKNKSSNTVGA